jgi:tetratricopeptide (TPR) repeat protein
MPFDRNARHLFVGRANELQFFIENILKPEEPSHNILSISGQGGVGKTYLLNRFKEETQASGFKDYCLSAFVDYRQPTPVNIMESFATQLHFTGKFEKAVVRYKDPKLQDDLQLAKADLVRAGTGLASDMVGIVPGGGPLLRPVVKENLGSLVEYLLAVWRAHTQRKEAKRQEDPIGELTKAFIEELNALVSKGQRKRQRRVILFFDTFEQLAPEIVPWFLDYLLEGEIKINPNVVLVVAGRSSIERSTPDPKNLKRWARHLEENIIHPMLLESFTEDETRAYLVSRGITEVERIATIWRLSQGLPLSLLLWAANPQGTIDPTEDVVANFLQWIPEEESSKRKLVLEAALLSRPFNQDDLEAFSFVSEGERPVLYGWLTRQPFVLRNPQGGKYSYHEAVQELFSRYLYQRSPNEYQATRAALAAHYQRLLTRAEITEGRDVSDSAQWLELTLALAYQLFLLPDEASHIQAIERVLNMYDVQTEQAEQIRRFLRDLLRAQLDNQRNTDMRQTVEQLVRYIEACEDQRILRHERNKQELLSVADYFIEKVAHHPSFSKGVLASLYCSRGEAYHELRNYKQALADCNRAIKLDPSDAAYYDIRGYVYLTRGDYQQTIVNYNRAIKLDSSNAAYYTERGRAYREIEDYDRALADQNRALELDPQLAWGYVSRGFTYLWRNHQGDIERALSDLLQSWELRPTDPAIGLTGLHVQWCRICQEQATLEVAKQLEEIATFDAKSYEAHVCRGVALWIRGHLNEGLTELERAIQVEPEAWEPYFWHGLIRAYFVEQWEDAFSSLEQAVSLGLPPVLLTPLRWLEQDCRDFHKKYVVTLLAQYEVDVGGQ